MTLKQLKALRAKLGDRALASSKTRITIDSLDSEIKEREIELNEAYERGKRESNKTLAAPKSKITINDILELDGRYSIYIHH